ncbi:hypothetical protein FisN_12Lu012 [Fistulifera solaris]|uniref:Mediator of RNA polymerase II transcription subunit 7 n=1 Tax=Fistulifera solaris TaxID=1519565 RepID=A0A1Z5KHG2_FISSO|nr:hypothetical protein FisN_12Lu012 [Fistulifera solaris]|eukprot:GAX25471.1 hypothetical protein FisN_12Lu012 [Fistulifera solaris]
MTEAAAEVSRTTVKNEDDDLPHEDAPGEATLLVSEFPPPPFYYPLADQLEPPPIPTEAVKNGTERAARVLAEARAEAERQRLGADTTNAILGGTVSQEDDENVVAVFGEVVEDPWLVQPLDLCEDPTVVREEVKRLNATVLQLFAQLAHDLVHRPLENKKTRDELSHNIFLMLQECNKFREHQAHETLIEMLEKQLAQRKQLVRELRSQMESVEQHAGSMNLVEAMDTE